MGSFTQPGCTSLEDALWHINSARDHDGLPAMEMDQLESLVRGTDKGKASFTQE
jgi:hypothetical protein